MVNLLHFTTFKETQHFNILKSNFPKWPDALYNSCSMHYKILKACVAILEGMEGLNIRCTQACQADKHVIMQA